ncbi:B3 domain-containing protein REM8-like isoform X1 [Raphanus sativus]|uniref:B3 domain-containing protein REM8-like isoform X1 n=1 Tax=Raphanus sativus TaxID=3726 RepID=A0A9W3DNS8_RAPSA|nr:B3 domain-containing protein REM8-like isoform X1 [Raphanus sativus]
MVKASLFPPPTPHFFQPFLLGSKSHLNIPVKFFSEHIEGKHEGKTVTLRSDALEETWKVKMEGQRLTHGWKEFVEAHVLGVGDFVVFRHERDMLFHVTALGSDCCEIQYTPSGSRRQEDEEESVEIERSAKEVEKNLTKFVKLTPTSSSFETGRQHLPASFTRVNGLIKPGKIILVDKKGAEWVMELKVEKTNGSIMYMYIMSRNGWSIFCRVNEVRAGESLTLELIRGGASPMLKFCSKMEQPPFEAEASAHKRAKWSQEIKEKTAEGEPSHRTRASKETNANQENLQDKQPCSVSDLLMTKVKHSVVSTLTSIRRFREELKTKEQELEDTLQEIKNLVPCWRTERRRQRE